MSSETYHRFPRYVSWRRKMVRKMVQGNYVRARFSLSFGLVVLMNGCAQVLPCTREGDQRRRGFFVPFRIKAQGL